VLFVVLCWQAKNTAGLKPTNLSREKDNFVMDVNLNEVDVHHHPTLACPGEKDKHKQVIYFISNRKTWVHIDEATAERLLVLLFCASVQKGHDCVFQRLLIKVPT